MSLCTWDSTFPFTVVLTTVQENRKRIYIDGFPPAGILRLMPT